MSISMLNVIYCECGYLYILDFRQNSNGETPLHRAVFNSHVRFILAETLINHNANVNVQSVTGICFVVINQCKLKFFFFSF